MSVNQIETTYSLEAEDRAIIRTHSTGVADDWDNDAFEPFKKRIIRHLRFEQERRCCYCKILLRKRKQSYDVEHIIPKSRHPRFTFRPKNLALSCKACNSSKSTKSPFSTDVPDDSLVRIPHSPNAYKIIHPYLDDYYLHIDIIDDVLIHALTNKGDDTVEHCDLYNPELAIDKATDIGLDPADIFGLFMRMVLSLPTLGFDDEDDIFERLEQILDAAEEDL